MLTAPRTDPGVRYYRTGLLPRMSDEEPLFRPWMEDARIWQVAICDLFHSAPWQSMLLTSTSDGAEPTIDYVMPKRCDRRRTHWHRVIREPATQDLAEPYALSLYAIMASCSKMFLYLPQLRSHPFAHRCPSKHETAAASPGRAVMRESEKIERLRLPKASSLTACYCMPSELDEPRLIGMKTEPKLRKASREVREEPLRVLRMLEADDRIVRIADDDHLTRRLALAPPADPQVIDIVEVDVSEERRNHRALGRPFLGLDPAAFLEHTCR